MPPLFGCGILEGLLIRSIQQNIPGLRSTDLVLSLGVKFDAVS